jgi:hypothetical protein
MHPAGERPVIRLCEDVPRVLHPAVSLLAEAAEAARELPTGRHESDLGVEGVDDVEEGLVVGSYIQ